MPNSTQQIPNQPVKFIIFCSREHKRWAITALLAVISAVAVERIMIYLLKELTDAAIAVNFSDSVSVSTLWHFVWAYPTAYFLCTTSYRISGFTGMRWHTLAGATAYNELFRYLSAHSLGFFHDRFAGALSNKVSNAVKGMQALLGKSLWEILPVLIGFVGYVIILGLRSSHLAWIFSGWFIAFIAVNILIVRRLFKLYFEQAVKSSELRGQIVDSTTNIETVHHGGLLKYESDLVEDYVEEARKSHLKSWWASEWLLVLNGLLLTAFCLSMIAAGIFLLDQGKITVGDLVMAITIVIALQRTLFFIGVNLSNAVGEFGQIKEGLEELLLPHDIKDSPTAKPLELQEGRISLDNVSFSYGDVDVFKDFSIEIAPKQKIGLVGVSGAGKSTFVSLILREYDVLNGKIEIDSQDVKDIELESLRLQIGVVPQTSTLFHRSIFKNIQYGNIDASEEEVREAAKLARAHDFISNLPKGYETTVGERGVKLSGGQRQRIAIARAILKNAPILILDEATSALDSESEEAVQEALSELIKDKTVIAIAHRLSTLRMMDRLIILENGEVVEDGSHEELLKAEGQYHKLWTSQVGGFIQD